MNETCAEGRQVRLLAPSNPTIAITMLRRDLDAGLFVPVELLVTENPDGRGAKVLYVRPSSLIAVRDDADLETAATRLDAKLGALVESIAGIAPPTER